MKEPCRSFHGNCIGQEAPAGILLRGGRLPVPPGSWAGGLSSALPFSQCRLAAAAQGQGPKILARQEDSSEEEEEEDDEVDLTPEELGRWGFAVL